MIKRQLKQILESKYKGFDVLEPDSALGDYSINLAFNLAKLKGEDPRILAHQLVEEIFQMDEIRELKVEVSSEGAYINFRLTKEFLENNLKTILSQKSNYGDGQDKNKKVVVEFVSANPTGPLTVANIRAGSYGDTLANVLRKSGFQTSREYYINDMGVQVRKLGESFYKKYLKNFKHQNVEFGEDLYQGSYVDEYVSKIVMEDVGESVAEGMSQDAWQNEAVEMMINAARQSMKNLGIAFDTWFYESDLHNNGEISKALKVLESSSAIFEKDGAKWIKYDGDKEAVVVKSDGLTSYLMNDVAYTKNKFERGFDRAINIWGADHHGDAPRLKAGVVAIGYEATRLEILLHQLVFIKKGEERQRMSKRKGEFVLLDELLAEVGKDAVRFFFLVKDLNTHMEFDIDLAKEQSKKNPVYYIQYAFARLSSIFEKTGANPTDYDYDQVEIENSHDEEISKVLVRFPDIIADIAEDYQVHHLAQYTLDLATGFHKFYEANRIIGEDGSINKNRLSIAMAVSHVLGECLNLLGLEAKKKM